MAWEPSARRIAALAILLVTSGMAGCIGMDDTTTNEEVGPTGRSEVGTSSDGRSYDASSKSNQPGNFAYQGAMGNQDKTENVTWMNPTARAQFAWQGTASTGSFTLTITDAMGNVVYERTVDATSAGQIFETSSIGVPGPWTLTFDFQGFTGSMQMSIRSA